MLARIKKDSQNNLTWERLTSTVVGSTPLGAVYGIYSNTVPDGFLPCNGVAFDRTQYPFLYNMLGDNHTPDLRECTLVGIGENTTNVTALHDIYTLGQYKDFSTAGSGEVKTAGYSVSGNNVTLNTTVNASNRKLVTQYIADADATDLQTLDIGGDDVTRMRSKGINYIIKAIPGNEIGDYNYVIDQMEAQLALKVSLDYVNALPTGDEIDNNIYGYNGHYYVGYRDEIDPATDSFLTELANQDDLTVLQPKTLDTTLTIGGSSITTVEGALAALNTVKLEKGIFDVNALPVSPDIEDLVYRYNGDIYFGDSTNQTTTLLDAEAVVWVDENDPLPTGASIKAKVYVQPETVSASVTKYHYYVGDTSVTPHVLREIESGGADIFVGTLNDWNLLSTAEQNAYTQANITDANGMGTTVVDTVQDGNLNAVSSNAVYDFNTSEDVASPITAASGVNNAYPSIVKVGNLAIISNLFYNSDAITSGMTVGTIKAGYRPVRTTRIKGVCQKRFTTVALGCNLVLNTDGTIVIDFNGSDPVGEVFLSGVYALA